ncbi:hypothetical protein ACJJTC_005337 [Scirpophaga incertulas]
MTGCQRKYSILSLPQVKRKPGGQYLRYRDVFKRHLTAISMSSESWEELATKRTEWRTAVKTGLEKFESTRLEELVSKRQHRKSRPKPSYIRLQWEFILRLLQSDFQVQVWICRSLALMQEETRECLS